MAYNKVFSRVTWENEPSTATPLNQTNLNKSDYALDVIDDRVVELDGRVGAIENLDPQFQQYLAQAQGYANSAANSADSASSSASSASTSETNAATSENNALEYSRLAATSKSDSEAYAVGQREGIDVANTDPTYHNNSKYYSEVAGVSATNAATSESNSEAWAVGKRGGTDVPSTDPTYNNNSKYYSERAAQSVTDAAGYASNAADSATSAESKVEDAQAWAEGKRGDTPISPTDPAYHNNAKYYAESCISSVESAAASERNASDSADAAALSETNAALSEQDALDHKEDSEAWAVGQRNGTNVPPADPTYHNNAKYWAEQAQAIVGIDVMQGATDTTDGRSGLVPQPLAGDQDKVLFGDGSFREVKSSALLIDAGYVAIDYSILG